MSIPGYVQITGPLGPTSTTDTFPTHDATYGAGGLRTVADHPARDAIPTARRQQGMLVVTLSDGLTWQLNAQPWNGNDADWTEFTTGSSSTFPYVPPISFAFGDAAGIVWTAPVAGTVTVTRVDIATVFNGAGASVKVGTMGSIEALMPAALNDPTTIGAYELVADLDIASGTGIWLQVTPGSGGTAGAGRLFLSFVPDA